MVPRHLLATALVLALAAGARAADPEKDPVQLAIKGGQDYLRAAQRGGGGGFGVGHMPVFVGGNGCGTACLTGLALIETGVPAGDPLVANLARMARQAAVGSTSTYEISLLIMFLDRVGAKEDEGLIQFLTLRLLSGQYGDGSWSYSCSGLILDPVEERLLRAELVKEVKLTTPDPPKPPKPKAAPREDLDFDGPPKPKKDKPEPKEEPKEEPKKKKLHPALEKYERAARAGGAFGRMMGGGDHSNTQFATVGLWCGRRHGVDVADALTALDKHYRGCQAGDGGWGYTSTVGASSPAMSCAGLMGLAMGHGAKNLDGDKKKADPDALAKDANVADGLKYVGQFLAAAAAEQDPRGRGRFQPNDLSRNLYFMWSLERVGMVYGLTTIGKVDWYDWGSKCLVASQERDGSWRSNGFHGGSPENSTAFALLFLARANLAEDLATSLKGKVKDPGTSRLVGGGDLGKMLKGTGSGSTGPRTDSGTAKPKTDTPPAVGAADEAGKLAAALVAATGAERDALLDKYRDAKGGQHTDALARAAGKLSGADQARVRDALAQRLTRMTAGTLTECMKDRDKELRRAAALAAGAKGKARLPDFAPGLIRLIADDEPVVVQAARASLKALTDQDFGPEVGASATDRGKALVAWRNWWEAQKK